MYEYRAFGEQLKRLDNNGDETDDSAKYSYGGKELDDGTNLYYFNARYYDATIGRFINVDPVQDGSNWYVYCGNNPMCFIDPTGLYEVEYQNEKNWTDDEKQAVEDAYNEAEEYVDNSIEYLEEHIKGLKEKDKDGNLDKAIENATKALKNFQKLQKGFKSKDKLVFIKKDFEPWREGTLAAITFLTLLNLENVVELGINKNTNFFDQSIKTQTEYITHELLHVEDIYHNIDGSGPWYSNPYYLSTPFNWKIECANE